MLTLEQTILWLRRITIWGILTGIALSHKLWLGVHSFPTFPVFGNFSISNPTAQLILGILFISLLVISLFLKRQHLITWMIIATSILLVLLDQNRLQPWFYQYVITLILLNLFESVNGFRLFFSSIYFWSGLQKINIVFMASIFPWMIAPILNHTPSSWHQSILILGIIAPFIEILIGIGLMTKRFKFAAGIAGISMHTGILILLGPWGHNWNSVVWPWNLAMMGIIIILMKSDPAPSLFTSLSQTKKISLGIILTIVCIFPVFNFINKWDSYLSASLYSGTPSTAIIMIDNQPYNFVQASFDELNVPPYPEPRIYRTIAKNLCQKFPKSQVSLEIVPRKNILKKENPVQKYSCEKL